ncbi:hypothetical protein [Sulfurovum sp. NBC37-1]|uniref:hypothetical protein n=1 Tax=Sulfurovum sp. (strain NBC37-1) TaxID=387093 RepID=UPI0002DC533B|nr:hypothetical protein [Sulfurovum sp. NBC37-1]
MIRLLLLLNITTLFLFAGEKLPVPSSVIVGGALLSIVLFFWGIYKAVRTQKTVYALAFLPFLILIVWMFVS